MVPGSVEKVHKEALVKPRFCWLNPGAAANVGKVGCWLFNEGTGVPQELVSPRSATGTFSWHPNALSFNGSQRADWTPGGVVGSGALTYVVRVMRQATTTNTRFISIRDAAGTHEAWTMGGGVSAGDIQFTWWGAGNGNAYVNLPTVDVWENFAAVHDGSIQLANQRLYRNGIAQSLSGNDATAALYGYGGTISMGDRTTGGRAFDGYVEHADIYLRALPSALAMQLSAEPYGCDQYLVPTNTSFWIGVAGGTLYTRTADAGIGSGAGAGRVCAAIRTGAAGVGGNAAGGRVLSALRAAAADITSGASGGRVFGASRTGAAGIGTSGSGDRQLSAGRSAAAGVGTAGTAGRVLSALRSAAADVGASGAVGRVLGALRAATAGIGTSGTAGRVFGAIRSGAAGIGTAAGASRVFAAIRAAAAGVGTAGTASRVYAAIRTASAGIGVHAVRTVAAAGRYLIVRFNRLFGRGIGP